MISILIPTIRDSLALTLTSLIGQGEGEVIILDEGDKSVMADKMTRYAADALSLNNYSIKHIRRLRQGIGKARFDLINEAKYPTCLFIDDDNVLAPNALEKLREYLTKGIFITPAIVQVNNEIGWTHYDYPKVNYEVKELLSGLWESQWRNTKEKHLVKVTQTSANCILFDKTGIDFSRLEKHNQLGEDQIFCSCFKGGLVRTDAVSYHFMQSDEKRKWQTQAEDIYRRGLQ